MKVSVIVAAYNVENYIQRCLTSIINQTLKDIEIIVINDGSTDKTLYKINELVSQDSRIKVIDQNNQGIANTRKNGLNAATGEYILFVDGAKTLLPPIKITKPFGFQKKWIIQDTESMIDLSFTPHSDDLRIFSILSA